jgi:peptide/nickel transport system permease protein
VELAEPARKRARSFGAEMLAQAWRTGEFKFGFVVLLALMLMALFGPQLLGLSATKFDVAGRFQPPMPL